jgi:hypothetical protein
VADQRKNEISGWFILLIVIAAIVASDVAKQHTQNSAAIGLSAAWQEVFGWMWLLPPVPLFFISAAVL